MEEKCLESVKNGYLYSMWNGIFTVYEGYLHSSIPRQHPHFKCKNLRKGLGVAHKEGEIYNAMVWLYDRNDDKARKILLDYEETLIRELQARIENHQVKIDLLSKPIISK